MIDEITQKRILALITLPLWSVGSYLTMSAFYKVIHILANDHYCDFPESGCSTLSFLGFPESGCSTLSFLGFAIGLGMLFGTAYAFMANQKKESRKLHDLHP